MLMFCIAILIFELLSSSSNYRCSYSDATLSVAIEASYKLHYWLTYCMLRSSHAYF